MVRGLVGCVVGFALLGYAFVGAVQAPRTLESLTEPERPKRPAPKGDTAADRQAFIAACEGRGGIAVVRAGALSSRGIDCAAPLGE